MSYTPLNGNVFAADKHLMTFAMGADLVIKGENEGVYLEFQQFGVTFSIYLGPVDCEDFDRMYRCILKERKNA